MELLSKEEILKEYDLNQMIRYNTRNKICKENVAAHTCFVSIFCLKIMSQLKLSPEVERDVLVLAALHDVPEIEISDIPHIVKEKHPEIREILEKLEIEYYEKNWEKYKNIMISPSKLAITIMLLADIYSVMQFCYNDIDLGNRSEEMQYILNHAIERANECLTELNNLLEEEKYN